VLTAREPYTLKYTHLDSRTEATTHTITMQLKEVGDITRLELTQDGNDQEGADMGEKIWDSMFDDLESALKGAPAAKSTAARK
jgi:Activator of Hsp90 ATPase homolog 1-like protein